jgi:hypothetical protein
MRVLLFLLISICFVACSNDSLPGEYPYAILEGDIVVHHPSKQDSLSLARVKKHEGGRLDKSLVNNVTGFGPETLYLAYEPDGSAAMAYATDNAWIALPTTQSVLVDNSRRELNFSINERLEIQSRSRCVRSASSTSSAIILIESTGRSFRAGVETGVASWVDSVWWSRRYGAISKMKYHLHRPEIEEWEMQCQFADGFIEVK